MLNLVVAAAAGLAVFGLVTLLLGWVPAVLPGAAVAMLATYLLTRRVSQAVEPEMNAAVALLQDRKIDEAKAQLQAIKQRWGRWQLFLEAQIDAQLGMIEYMQMKWDAALPLLRAGQWRNWMALTCIGCIHWRKDAKEDAYNAFSSAVDASSAEMAPYMVWATLLERDGKRDEALKVCDRGIKGVASGKFLVELRDLIANKKKIDTRKFPQEWYQYFPDDLMAAYQQRAAMKGKHNPEDDNLPPLPGETPAPDRQLNRAQRRALAKQK